MKNFYNNWILPHRRHLLIGLLLVLTAFRMALFLRTPLAGAADAGSDDWNLISHAWQLLHGGWLGPLENNTLTFGLSFPAFLVLCQKLCIPFMFAVSLLYIGSIIYFLDVWKEIFRPTWLRITIYLFLLYAPVMMTVYTAQRVWDLTLAPALILLLLALGLRLFQKKLQHCLPEMIVFSILFTFFWYLRQLNYWIIPLFLGFIGFTAYVLKKENAIKRLALFILPAGLIILSGLGIALLNNHYYSRFAVYASDPGVETVHDDPMTLAKNTFFAVFHMASNQMTDVDTYAASGNADDLRLIESMSGSQVLYPDPNPLKISGWAFPTADNSNLEVALIDENGVPLAYAEFENSEDVYMSNMDYAAARVCRFSMEAPISDISQVSLAIYLNGEQLDTYPVEFQAVEHENYHLFLEQAEVVQDPNLTTAKHTVAVSKVILFINRILGIVLMILAVLSYIGLCLSLRKKGTAGRMKWCFLTLTGLTALLGIIINFILYPAASGFDASAYCSGPWMLIQLFILLSITWYALPLSGKIMHSKKQR
jgi:hypothetical protein